MFNYSLSANMSDIPSCKDLVPIQDNMT